MKSKLLTKIAKWLMTVQPLKVTIIDDVKTYFNDDILKTAQAAGYKNIERLYKVDKTTLNALLKNPPDIIILDIKGIADQTVAKNGFDIARIMQRETDSFVVVTSAHKHKLKHQNMNFDYVINERILTPVDFLDEFNAIIQKTLETKLKFHKKILFKIGYKLGKLYLTSQTGT